MTLELPHWPDLSSLATSVNLTEDRREYIGGSDANIIFLATLTGSASCGLRSVASKPRPI